MHVLSPTAEDIYGKLFTRVQERAIFADSKAFVDAVPKRDLALILADYAKIATSDEALLQFITDHFVLPLPSDSFIPDAVGQPLREHIRGMWHALAREPVARVAGSSALAIGHRHVVPGGRFRELYYWDSYFSMLGLIRDGQRELAGGIVDAMTDLIEEYGYVPNGTRSYYLGRSQPPLYYLMVELLDDPRPAIAARRLAAMKREHGWWMAGADDLPAGEQHAHVVRLADGSLFNRFWDARATPREESWGEDVATARSCERNAEFVYRDLRAGAESGWDFSSRWLDGEHLSSIRTTTIAPVDLNAFLFGLECAIAAGGGVQAPAYAAMAERRRVSMHSHFWNEEAGHFADYDLEREELRPHATAAALVPLFVGLASSPQAEATARFVASRLLAPGGLRTTLVRSSEQWDSPNGWAPLHWMAVQGLHRYGDTALAREIARRWIKTVETTYRDTGLLHEKYDVECADIGSGGEYAPQIGFGWTNGVTAALLDQGWDADVLPDDALTSSLSEHRP